MQKEPPVDLAVDRPTAPKPKFCLFLPVSLGRKAFECRPISLCSIVMYERRASALCRDELWLCGQEGGLRCGKGTVNWKSELSSCIRDRAADELISSSAH